MYECSTLNKFGDSGGIRQTGKKGTEFKIYSKVF